MALNADNVALLIAVFIPMATEILRVQLITGHRLQTPPKVSNENLYVNLHLPAEAPPGFEMCFLAAGIDLSLALSPDRFIEAHQVFDGYDDRNLLVIALVASLILTLLSIRIWRSLVWNSPLFARGPNPGDPGAELLSLRPLSRRRRAGQIVGIPFWLALAAGTLAIPFLAVAPA